MRGAPIALLVLALLLPVAGCDRLRPGETPQSRLIVAWTGSDTGAMAAKAVAEWCDSLRVLEIRGVHGDSGLAMAIYPLDQVQADSYPVMLPDRADSTRPSASLGARWFAEASVKGFQGDRGAVIVEQANGRVSGRFRARMRSVTNGSRLELEGTFRRIAVVPATRGCVSRPPAQPPDTGID